MRAQEYFLNTNYALPDSQRGDFRGKVWYFSRPTRASCGRRAYTGISRSSGNNYKLPDVSEKPETISIREIFPTIATETTRSNGRTRTDRIRANRSSTCAGPRSKWWLIFSQVSVAVPTARKKSPKTRWPEDYLSKRCTHFPFRSYGRKVHCL